MAGRRMRSWRPWASGLTLVEVLLGLALLGGLLVSLLVTRGQALTQQRRAERRLEACGQADALLARWFADPAGPPASGQGNLDAAGTLRWRIEGRPDATVEALGGQVRRLRVWAADDPAAALVEVEFVVGDADAETTTRPDAG